MRHHICLSTYVVVSTTLRDFVFITGHISSSLTSLTLLLQVAITVSFRERVDCLICLGLQLQGIAGNTADAVDVRDLLQLKPPTLFAIGSQVRTRREPAHPALGTTARRSYACAHARAHTHARARTHTYTQCGVLH